MSRPKATELNPKQMRFVEEYLVDANATQAAIRAGYSPKAANKSGAMRLMAEPLIKAEIDKRMKVRSEKIGVTQDYVLRGLIELAERCMQEVKPMMTGRGEPVLDENGNMMFKFDSAGAAKAYELLGKHLGMFKDKVDVKAEVLTNEQCDAAVRAFMLGRK